VSGFSTLNTAVTGLAAAQRAMDAASQNIVNANTPGYSRQRVLLESTGATTSATFHTGNGAVFGGVRVADVSRIHDAFLEATRAAAGARQSTLSAQTDILSATEVLLSEPGETGVQNSLDSFYSSWHDLSLDPTNSAPGSVVIERGVAVAEQLKAVSDGISEQWSTAKGSLQNVVSQVNQAATDLAKVNGSIRAGQAAGHPVNELLDTRDTLTRTLASLVGGTATTDDEGQVSVSVNGVAIVSGETAQTMTVAGANDISNALADPPSLSISGYAVSVDSGSAAGLLATMRTDLPTMSAKVDAVAVAIRDAVNGIYATGFSPDGSTGGEFYTGTDAKTLSVVPTDGSTLAIAAAAGTKDGSVARLIGDLSDDVKSTAALGGATGPSAQWRNLTAGLGVQLQSLKTAGTVQDSVVAAADDAVTSDSGVNLDEEMTNMMLYQRSYQASARAITTVDDMLDTLINRTGLVGR
jgi:flagellar hook-associated protein 1 FlgK